MTDLEEAKYCIKCATALVTRNEGEQARKSCPNCGWVCYPRPNVASAVAILQGDQVLMVRRKHEPFAGQWTLPSGFMELGEDPEETAVREMGEELGVEVDLTGLVDVLVERGDPRGLCLLVVYTGEIRNGEPVAGDDASEIGIFPLDSLPRDIAWKAHREALEELRALL